MRAIALPPLAGRGALVHPGPILARILPGLIRAAGEGGFKPLLLHHDSYLAHEYFR